MRSAAVPPYTVVQSWVAPSPRTDDTSGGPIVPLRVVSASSRSQYAAQQLRRRRRYLDHMASIGAKTR